MIRNPVTSRQTEKAKRFYDLHHQGKLLILPNIWDPLGAILLESLGYPAVATASASVAFSNGYDDGENIAFTDVLNILKKITNSVDIPVSADVERGFAENDTELRENTRQLIQTGIVGINIEDTEKKTNSLLPIEVQCQRIRAIKEVAKEMGVPLFINARTDVYIRGKGLDTPQSRFDETLKRGVAYKAAGADCFYPITLSDRDDLKKLIEQLQMPVNVVTIAGLPQLSSLDEVGVARVSLGPSFLKIAIRSMKNLATKLQNYDGLSDITENDITSAYLKDLVNKNY
ncbi:MAG TPA: isocitrate lyase/phosphoenolpyruvate mutase family protein [Chitinophagaceae bacterium]|nr:isocitrate lyase/phosphoenolpyruvate mutase family protein [Chitinophagaceae bacterium]